MKGDWVQAKYYINPTQWTTQAQSVAPLRYCRLDQVKKLMSVSFSSSAIVWSKMQWLCYICFLQVRVTSMFNNTGVVEDSVFFSLDSLLLPTHYQPALGHVVNLVMVESTQSLYCWRALCMAPWDYRYQQRCLQDYFFIIHIAVKSSVFKKICLAFLKKKIENVLFQCERVC